MVGSAAAVVGRAMAALVLLAGLVLAALAAPGQLAAQTPVGDWQPTGIVDGAVLELQAPDSGSFFAAVQHGEGQTATYQYLRSDDGGETWRPVPLEHLGRLRVHPADHTIQYAQNDQGLYRSSDDGATWQLILP